MAKNSWNTLKMEQIRNRNLVKLKLTLRKFDFDQFVHGVK